MKIIKKIIVVIVIVVALPFVVAFFSAKDYAVEREITINKPKKEVFDYIKYLKNQENYSTWAMKDPDMKKTFTGTDGTVGFISAWDSEKEDVGKGEQEIIKITPGEKLDFELRFIEPFEAKEPAYMTTESVSKNETKVKWGFNGHMDYPMNMMLLFMNMEEEIGKDLQVGLDNLKILLEKE